MSEQHAGIEISGMSCAMCSGSVEEAVRALSGVTSVSANFATDEAHVEFNPARLSLPAIYEAIEGAGYDPVREDAEDGEALTERRESAIEREMRKQWRLVLFGGLLTLPFVPMMVDMLFGLAGIASPIPDAIAHPPGWLEFGLATVLMATLGKEFLVGAWRAFSKNRRANMDTLVAVGTSAGYLFSTAVLLGAVADGGLYFEAVAFILWFITLGNWLEARSKARASDALRSLLEMEAEEATLVRGGEEVVVPLSAVAVGDHMKVRPGERIPTDGVVRDGESAVD